MTTDLWEICHRMDKLIDVLGRLVLPIEESRIALQHISRQVDDMKMDLAITRDGVWRIEDEDGKGRKRDYNPN